MSGPRAALGVRQDSSAPLPALASRATGPAHGAAVSRPARKEPA